MYKGEKNCKGQLQNFYRVYSIKHKLAPAGCNLYPTVIYVCSTSYSFCKSFFLNFWISNNNIVAPFLAKKYINELRITIMLVTYHICWEILTFSLLYNFNKKKKMKKKKEETFLFSSSFKQWILCYVWFDEMSSMQYVISHLVLFLHRIILIPLHTYIFSLSSNH